ncbi:VOC family protein [Caproiciproducens sp. NJN-50]|uniref:VOC family protein n=1 Tax=Acutalibacteraceae TaxID=3082771 RepID=UPI000FFE1425|nr:MULTISPECIES: VOC family protein [Acutalibacteraceae]QAT50307.1 VOC family protein [Caproiciproducens sp. NJN-50]
MNLQELTAEIQHIGIPTDDIGKTVAFYTGLGFETVLRTKNETANEPVAFLRLKNLTIETYETRTAKKQAGAIDHIALNVADIDRTFQAAKAEGYSLLDKEVRFLPFWEHGVRFFTIEGPNAEKIEFSQIL